MKECLSRSLLSKSYQCLFFSFFIFMQFVTHGFEFNRFLYICHMFLMSNNIEYKLFMWWYAIETTLLILFEFVHWPSQNCSLKWNFRNFNPQLQVGRSFYFCFSVFIRHYDNDKFELYLYTKQVAVCVSVGNKIMNVVCIWNVAYVICHWVRYIFQMTFSSLPSNVQLF